MDYLENTPTIIISQDSSSKYPYMVVLCGEPGYHFVYRLVSIEIHAGICKVWQQKEWIQITDFNTKEEGIDVQCPYAPLIALSNGV